MSKKILLVEDDTLSAEFMRLFLEGEGHAILHSGSCGEACAVIEAEKPDILITDIELADGSGFEVAAHARRHATKTTIAVSGHDIEEITKQHGPLEGVFSHVLTKPVNLEELGRIVASI